MKTSVPIAAFCTLYASAAFAQSGPPDGVSRPEDRYSLIFGLGGGIAPEYEGAGDYGFQPGGVIQGKVDGFDFQVRGPNIYVDLIRDAPGSKVNLILGPLAQLRPCCPARHTQNGGGAGRSYRHWQEGLFDPTR
jgi:MipA family protein